MRILPYFLSLMVIFGSSLGFSYSDENSASINAGPWITPVSGATTLVGLRDVITGIEQKSAEKFSVNLHDGLKMVLRGVSMVAVELPLDYFAMLVQHEFFGHGARCREFDGTPAFVFVGAPFPYGLGGAEALCGKKELTAMQNHIMNVGGVTSGDVMANLMAKKWIANGRISGPATWLYLASGMQTTGYLLAGEYLLKANDIASASDINNYVVSLNRFYQSQTASSVGLLRAWSLLNFLDPLLFNSLYAMYHYVRYGGDAPVWTIPMGDNIRYLPTIKYTFAPFGPEFNVHNYLVLFDRVLDLHVRGGGIAGQSYWGVGLSGQAWRYKGLTLGGHVEIWRQPEILTHANFHYEEAPGVDYKFIRADNGFGSQSLGFLATVQGSFRFIDPVAIDLEIGGKSKGYVPGEFIDASMLLRAGLTIYF